MSLFAKAVSLIQSRDKAAAVSVSVVLTDPATGEKVRFSGKAKGAAYAGDFTPEGRVLRLGACPEASAACSGEVGSTADKSREACKSTGSIVANVYASLFATVTGHQFSTSDKPADTTGDTLAGARVDLSSRSANGHAVTA